MPSRYYIGRSVKSNKVTLSPAKCFADIIAQFLQNPIRLPITRQKFAELRTKEEKLDAKDCQYLVACTYGQSPCSRAIENTDGECNLVFLDIDDHNGLFPAAKFVQNPDLLLSLLAPFAFAAYTTASSTPQCPRMRVVVDAEAIPLSLYPNAAQTIGSRLGITYDAVSLVPNQPMLLPVLFKGQDEDFDHPLLITAQGRRMLASDITATTSTPRPETRNTVQEEPVQMDEVETIAFLRAPVPEATLEVVKEALYHLNPDMTYREWAVEVAMALRHQFTGDREEAAFELFDKWSEKGATYPGEEETRKQWDAVKPSPKGRTPVTIRTLLKRAAEAGWDPSAFKENCFETIGDWIQLGNRTRIDLMVKGLRKIAATPLLNHTEEETLLQMVRTRLRELSHTIVSLTSLRRDLQKIKDHRERVKAVADETKPEWAQNICFVTQAADFFDIKTGKKHKVEVFDAEYSRFLLPTPEQLEKQENSKVSDQFKPLYRPRDYLWNHLQCRIAYEYTYEPDSDEERFITREAKVYVNTYRAPNLKSDPRHSERIGKLLMKHLEYLIAEPEHQRTMMDYLAFVVQHPGHKVRWAPVLIGIEGIGKTIMAEAVGAVIGMDNYKLVQEDDIESGYNDWAFGAQFVCIEEIRSSGKDKYKIVNSLKGPISNNHIPITEKFRNSRTIKNVSNYFLLSNFEDALSLTTDARRYFVIKSRIRTREQKPPREHFDLIVEAMEQNPGGLKHFFETWEISPSFSPDGDAPVTQYLKEMVDDTADELTSTIKRLITEADSPLVQPDMIMSTTIMAMLEMQRIRFNHNHLSKVLKDLGYSKMALRVTMGDERPYVWLREGELLNWRSKIAELVRHRYEIRTLFPEDIWL